MQQTASTFFGDLNSILIQHLILQITKLTDPDTTFKTRNLTTQFLLKNSDFSGYPRTLAKLQKITERMDQFRARVAPARNKLISHLDLDAALGRKALGRASIAAWHRFWLDLQDFVQIMRLRYVDAKVPYHLNGVGQMSDADQVVKAIKESTYFQTLLDDKQLTRAVSAVAFGSKFYDV